jgi:hypothetical protein
MKLSRVNSLSFGDAGEHWPQTSIGTWHAALAYGAPKHAAHREVGPLELSPTKSSPAENLEQPNVEC